MVTLGTVIAARFVWMYPATYLPRLIPSIAARDPAPPWTYPTVLAWAGMRGVVSLAAAFALPSDFPERDLILFLTFVVVIGTLLLQGLTLPALIRRLGVVGREEQQDLIKEAGAQHAAANAALAAAGRGAAPRTATCPRTWWPGCGRRRSCASSGPGSGSAAGRRGEGYTEPPTVTFRRLRRAMIEAEREVFIEMRDRGQIDEEVLSRVQRELDLEESILQRD